MATATIVTEQQVMEMALPQLRELGTQLGLTSISRTAKGVLQQMVLDKLEESAPEEVQPIEEEVEAVQEETPARKKRHIEVFINEHHRRILDNDNISKSEKMRRLWKKEMSIADIHRVLDTHYSFTYGVIDRYRKILNRDRD